MNHGGRRKRHAVTECCQPSLPLMVIQAFPVIHVCAETKTQPRLLSLFFFSPHPSPFSYYLSPPLHLSLCPSPLCFLPANCCCTIPVIFSTEGAPSLLQPTFPCSISRLILLDLQDVQKLLTHPVPPVGWCSPAGDFTTVMMGCTVPSWTQINLSLASVLECVSNTLQSTWNDSIFLWLGFTLQWPCSAIRICLLMIHWSSNDGVCFVF